ncbi:MAG: hypothetical protein WBF88_17710 [Pusillimonas sp.]
MSTKTDEQEREAFRKHYGALFDLSETPDVWGNPRFVHESVEAMWYGWKDRAALQSQDWEDAEFELIQDGTPMASTFGKREDALREIQHYAAVYSQDGPVEIYEITRRRIEGDGK